MHLIVQAAILGLLTGGVYALMASGLTLAFGVMRVINVAQGAMIVAGAYVSYTLFTQLPDRPVRLDRDHGAGRVRGRRGACSWCSCGRCEATSGRSCRCW